MSGNKLFALVDCNNFFVSCERIFRPDLTGKPVVVAGSNDGCAVARSNEAKALGIPMGAPMFKYKELTTKHNIQILSGNFHLYGDVSRRLTQFLSHEAPNIEVYSIDESFLDISDLDIPDLHNWGSNIVQKIFHDIGVPVSIGIGPTKTLAKLASELAKKDPECGGVKITNPKDPQLKLVKVEDVWGIGRKNAPKLRAMAIGNAQDIVASNRSSMRSIMGSVLGERLFLELSGVPCHQVETGSKHQKVISATRTFGEDISHAYIVESALADLTARASFNLRRDQQLTKKLSIFVSSSRFKDNYINTTRSARLDYASSNTGQLISIANKLFSEIFDPKIKYHRAGVILTELIPEEHSYQIGLISTDNSLRQISKNHLMKDLDAINKRYGRGKVHYAAQDASKDWQPRRKGVSPAYTTKWQELPKIY